MFFHKHTNEHYLKHVLTIRTNETELKPNIDSFSHLQSGFDERTKRDQQ